ncbi:MAG: hypothetical protein KatS3mg092_0853 [Patescibacteria group bacterium]|nr:MAG: hypothetical protein KatS3mg092_0853 [Patescibacteria group bacterium]
MIKKRINLIINREDYRKYEEIFYYLQNGIYIILLIFFIILIYFLININNLNKKIDYLNLEKTSILKIISANTDKYARLNYLRKKYSDLTNFLKEDSNSYQYYLLLNTSLQDSSQSASIKTFIIDKDRNFEFTVIFSDFSSMRNFFQFLETEKFLKNFEKIFLKNFHIIGATVDKSENYELSFYGVFMPYEKLINNYYENNENKD